MSTLPGLESFELVTDESKTRVPLSGALLGWTDDVQHRLNEHAILKRSGSIHQSQGQGPRRFVFRVLLREPGASESYKSTEALLGREPFCTLLHPRFSRVPVVFVGFKNSEDMDTRTNGLIIDLSLCETGLREIKAESASGAARQGAAAAAQVVALTSSSPALAPLGLTLQGSMSAYQAAADDVSLSQYDLALALSAVQVAADALVLAAGVTVAAFQIVAQARLTYWLALQSYQLAGAQLPPIVPRKVPQRMSLSRFVRSLYGGGAQSMELEISRINAIPNPYAIPAGTVLLVPDPARVTITPPTGGDAGEPPRPASWALKNSPTTPGRLTWRWGADGSLLVDDKGSYAVLMAIVSHKGAYRWDRAYGTLISRVTRTRSTTGSQLASYARDGGAQVEAAGLASNVLPRAQRLASGRWRLRVSWTAAGQPVVQEITL